MSHRRSFPREFKLAAVKKVVEQGLTFTKVATDLGISDSAIRAWKRAFQCDGTLQDHLSQSTSVIAKRKRLILENRQLKKEIEILQTVRNTLGLRAKVIFDFIHKHESHWPTEIQCRTLGVSRSGYYKHMKQ
jgi:transposase